MSANKYDVNYFIAKFEAIPEGLWCTGEFNNGRGQFCAMGHCGDDVDKVAPPECRALKALFRRDGGTAIITEINDGLNPSRPEPTPKLRILAALRDIKAKGAK